MSNNEPKRSGLPEVDFGFSSVVLGAIGLLLFVFPVLAVPISGAGIVVGVLGIVARLVGGNVKVRSSVAGVMLSAAALVTVCVITYAPTGYFAPRSVYPVLQPVEGRPFVAPPSPPRTKRLDR